MQEKLNKTCPICKKKHLDVPLCYGGEAPYYLLELDPPLNEKNFNDRVELSSDQCVIDGNQFFIRGHIDIKILDNNEIFSWSVWCSVSEESFLHMSDNWENNDRINFRAYFGYLMTIVEIYPDTLLQKVSIKSNEIGFVPSISILDKKHPMTIDQQKGISYRKVLEINHKLNHSNI